MLQSTITNYCSIDGNAFRRKRFPDFDHIIISHEAITKTLTETMLYNILFKAEIQNYSITSSDTTYLVGKTLYHNEYDVILSHLAEIEYIKIYSDGTVRLQLIPEYYNESVREVIVLTNVKTFIATLKSI